MRPPILDPEGDLKGATPEKLAKAILRRSGTSDRAKDRCQRSGHGREGHDQQDGYSSLSPLLHFQGSTNSPPHIPSSSVLAAASTPTYSVEYLL